MQKIFCVFLLSHPARGAWIEIPVGGKGGIIKYRRTPQGVRGLKLHGFAAGLGGLGRTPQGVRGLK